MMMWNQPVLATGCLPAGTIIDRCYKITGIVGKGSFGAAYAAEDLNSGLQVSTGCCIPVDQGLGISTDVASRLAVHADRAC
jgi:hypothetical protein